MISQHSAICLRPARRNTISLVTSSAARSPAPGAGSSQRRLRKMRRLASLGFRHNKDVSSAGVLSYTLIMTPTQLQKILDAAQLSQAEAARQLGLDPRSMRRYIAGDIKIPRHIEIALKAVTETWSPTLELRAVNARLRELGKLAEEALQRISADAADCRRVAKSTLVRIDELRRRPLS